MTPPTPTWGYGPDDGPSCWADLSPDWALARDGRRQSPIDLPADAPLDAALPPLAPDYAALPCEVVRADPIVRLRPAPGAALVLGDERIGLFEVHHHAPAEHHVDGAGAPAELHFVHSGDDGALTVVGVRLAVGASSPGLASYLRRAEGGSDPVEFAALWPGERESWRYDGSLTNPPCTEGVRWIVLAEPLHCGADQLAALLELGRGTARPVQPLHDRSVRRAR